MAAYAASKAAVVALTSALAEEVAKDGILVNAIAPSTMDTPANRAAMPKADFLHRRVLQLEPFLRGGQIGDAALDVLQLPELLLVRVVERLGRISARSRSLSFRLDDHHRATHEAWMCLPAAGLSR